MKRKFIKFFICGAICSILILIINFSACPFVLGEIYREAMSGKDYLERTIYFVKQEKLDQALITSDAAQYHFEKAEAGVIKLRKEYFIFRHQPLKTQFDNGENLLDSSLILSRIIGQGVKLGANIENLLEGNKKISFSKFSISEKRKILKFIRDSVDTFEKIEHDLELTENNLNNLKYVGILKKYGAQIDILKTKIDDSRITLSKALPMLKIFPALFGYPESKNYLIMLQNSDELRPTGGFLGTFSILNMENGEISECTTHDIYHLDMPVSEALNIEPPEPLKKYLGINKWYMRDANWSPDWPQSADKIEWFYKKESAILAKKDKATKIKFNKNFDAVAAITPKLITDLLAITGPVKVEGVEYNKGNFVDLLEYRVEKEYVNLGIRSWDRKEVISEIYKRIKIKLFDLPFARIKEVINVFDKNIAEKNILIKVKDKKLQEILNGEGLSGGVELTQGDYLMVVDANMAALKTDAAVERQITYKLEQDGKKFLAKLRIDYINNGKFDWKTTRYRSYTRVYVPKKSKLIKSTGSYDGETKSYEDLEKTCFASFISVEPGHSGSLYFEYIIPPDFFNYNGYELYVQKQPGNEVKKMTVAINLGNAITTYAPVNGVEYFANSEIKWITDLNVDREFKIVI